MKRVYWWVVSLLGLVKGETGIIGDSLFSGGSTIPSLLENWSGHSIWNFAKVGASLQNGYVESIPSQYNRMTQTASTEQVCMKTIIMDGGGNDVFSRKADCQVLNERCKDTIATATTIVAGMLENMETNEVDQVLYLGFYYLQGLNKAVDYGMEMMAGVCHPDAVVPCFLVDPRNLSLSLGWDGIHPTEEGYRRLATAIWDKALEYQIPI